MKYYDDYLRWSGRISMRCMSGVGAAIALAPILADDV
jgi:hypothetical protein